MQKTIKSKTTIALIAFVLMLTLVSASFTNVSFAQLSDLTSKAPYYPTGPAGHPLASEPTKRSWYNPVPGWQMYQQYTGPQPAPSPWYAGASSGWARYNVSNCNYNDYSTGPQTAHIRWIDQYGQKVLVTHPDWGYNFRLGPRDQIADSYSGMLAACGYIITWISESGGNRLQAHDEWNGELVWETKMNSTVSDQPFWLLNAAGAPTIYCRGGNTVLGYSLASGNLIDKRTFPIAASMFYNSSKFGQLEIEETALYSPGGVVYGSSGGYWYCYSWNDPNKKLWGPVRAPGGVNTLVDDVLCGASQQLGVASGIDAITGELLWENSQVGGSQSTQAGGYGMFYVPCSTGSIHAFKAKTGELVWKNENLTGSYWAEFFMNVGDGKVFDTNRDGNIYCLDAFTGELKWSFFAGISPYEPWKSYYGSYGFHHVGIGGGSTAWGTGPGIYSAAVGDESIGTLSNIPGNMQFVINVETGELLFKYPGGTFSHNQHGVVADGLLVTWNPTYSQVQCFGKGNTKVELSTDVGRIANGEFVVINGRITDQSPAQPDTPCVSKESMEAWMTYIHGGYDAPPAGLIKGVQVSLVAVDQANNVIDLGTVTSDAMGYFKVSWTPKDDGLYKITASFTEDESYYSSWAVTDLTVTGAAVSATSGTSTPITADATMTTVTLAAIVVVAVIGAVNVFTLLKMRRHKGGNQK